MVPNLWQENWTLLIINQTQIMLSEMKLCITQVLKPCLFDWNDACILITGHITVVTDPSAEVAFKNCAPFIKCFTKINGETIDYAEDLDLVMPLYNLIEYSSNYSDTTGSLWFYSKDEAANFNNDFVKIDNFKSFK